MVFGAKRPQYLWYKGENLVDPCCREFSDGCLMSM